MALTTPPPRKAGSWISQFLTPLSIDAVQIQIAKGDLDDEESPDLRSEPLMEGLYF